MSRRCATTALLAAAVLGLCGAAEAQDFIRPDCRNQLNPPDGPFDTALHARWYKRFWTGDCDKLPMCLAGSPNWNDIVGDLLVRGGPTVRAALLPKACRLGQTIGLEWSRDKKIRRIDTGDLRVFKKQLDASGAPLRGVTRVETVVQAKLGRPVETDP
jgi:hypothetical protein